MSRTCIRCPLIVLMLCTLLGAAPATSTTAPAGVSIKRTAAKVTTRSFDPKHPPRDMPPLHGNEAAVTESKFACEVQIGVEITQTGDAKPAMVITDIKAQVQLEIVMWLPNNTSPKIQAHENGHREIAELFYKDAEAIATKIAQKYIGRKLDIDSVEQSHTRPIIQRCANEFCGEYLGGTEVPSEKVQQRFDALTDHGRNRLVEKEAIKQALATKS